MSQDFKVLILNLTSETVDQVTEWFYFAPYIEWIDIETFKSGQTENPEFVLVDEATEDFETLDKLYYLTERNIKIMSWGDIENLKDFLLFEGRYILNPKWMETELGQKAFNRALANQFSVFMDENFEPFFENVKKFKVTDHIYTGYISDKLASEAGTKNFDLLAIRGFLFYSVYYFSYLKQLGRGGLPIEVEFGFDKDYFGVQLHISVDEFTAEYVYSCFNSKLKNGSFDQILHWASQLTHFFEITHLEKPSKLIISAVWTEQSQASKYKFPNILVHHVQTISQVKRNFEKLLKKDLNDIVKFDPNAILEEELELPKTIIDQLRKLPADSKLNDEDFLKNAVGHAAKKFRRDGSVESLEDIDLDKMKEYMEDFPGLEGEDPLSEDELMAEMAWLQNPDLAEKVKKQLDKEMDLDAFSKSFGDSLEDVFNKVAGDESVFDNEVNKVDGQFEDIGEDAQRVKGQQEEEEIKRFSSKGESDDEIIRVKGQKEDLSDANFVAGGEKDEEKDYTMVKGKVDPDEAYRNLVSGSFADTDFAIGSGESLKNLSEEERDEFLDGDEPTDADLYAPEGSIAHDQGAIEEDQASELDSLFDSVIDTDEEEIIDVAGLGPEELPEIETVGGAELADEEVVEVAGGDFEFDEDGNIIEGSQDDAEGNLHASGNFDEEEGSQNIAGGPGEKDGNMRASGNFDEGDFAQVVGGGQEGLGDGFGTPDFSQDPEEKAKRKRLNFSKDAKEKSENQANWIAGDGDDIGNQFDSQTIGGDVASKLGKLNRKALQQKLMERIKKKMKLSGGKRPDLNALKEDLLKFVGDEIGEDPSAFEGLISQGLEAADEQFFGQQSESMAREIASGLSDEGLSLEQYEQIKRLQESETENERLKREIEKMQMEVDGLRATNEELKKIDQEVDDEITFEHDEVESEELELKDYSSDILDDQGPAVNDYIPDNDVERVSGNFDQEEEFVTFEHEDMPEGDFDNLTLSSDGSFEDKNDNFMRVSKTGQGERKSAFDDLKLKSSGESRLDDESDGFSLSSLKDASSVVKGDREDQSDIMKVKSGGPVKREKEPKISFGGEKNGGKEQGAARPLDLGGGELEDLGDDLDLPEVNKKTSPLQQAVAGAAAVQKIVEKVEDPNLKKELQEIQKNEKALVEQLKKSQKQFELQKSKLVESLNDKQAQLTSKDQVIKKLKTGLKDKVKEKLEKIQSLEEENKKLKDKVDPIVSKPKKLEGVHDSQLKKDNENLEKQLNQTRERLSLLASKVSETQGADKSSFDFDNLAATAQMHKEKEQKLSAENNSLKKDLDNTYGKVDKLKNMVMGLQNQLQEAKMKPVIDTQALEGVTQGMQASSERHIGLTAQNTPSATTGSGTQKESPFINLQNQGGSNNSQVASGSNAAQSIQGVPQQAQPRQTAQASGTGQQAASRPSPFADLGALEQNAQNGSGDKSVPFRNLTNQKTARPAQKQAGGKDIDLTSLEARQRELDQIPDIEINIPEQPVQAAPTGTPAAPVGSVGEAPAAAAGQAPNGGPDLDGLPNPLDFLGAKKDQPVVPGEEAKTPETITIIKEVEKEGSGEEVKKAPEEDDGLLGNADLMAALKGKVGEEKKEDSIQIDLPDDSAALKKFEDQTLQIEQLNDELLKGKSENLTLNKVVDELKKRLGELAAKAGNESLKRVVADIPEMKAKAAEMALQREMAKISQQKNRALDEAKALKEENIKLKEKGQDKQEVNKLKGEFNTMKAKATEFENKFNQSHKKASLFEKKVKEMEESLRKAKIELADLKKKGGAQGSAAGGNSSAKVKSLELGNKKLQQEISQQKQALTNTKRELAKHKADLMKKNNEVTKLKRDLQKAKRKAA